MTHIKRAGSPARSARRFAREYCAHVEVAALRDACGRLKTLDLSGSTPYSTLAPCPMCFWAMQEARVARLVLGGRYAGLGRTDIGRYNVESFMEFTGRRFELVTGVLQKECEAVRLEWAKARERCRQGVSNTRGCPLKAIPPPARA